MAKGIKLNAPKQMKIVPMDLPEQLNSNEVLIKVKTGGICGSDIHIYDGSHPIGDYPKIIGHEFAGLIEKTGSAVENLKSGDKVVVNPLESCGTCYACATLGKPNICSNLKVRGVHLDGGFCTHIIVPVSSVFKFDNMNWNSAALVEPFTIAAQITDKGRIYKDDTILINGAGAIGLSTLILSRLTGAKIIAVDLYDSHLEKATELGADLVINPAKQSVFDEVQSFTDGAGVSVIVEAVGNTATFNGVIKCAAQGARIVLIGFDKKNLDISPFDITFNEFELIGSRLQTNKFQYVIDLIESGKVNPEDIVTDVFNYEDAPTVFPFMINKPDKVIKVILEF